MSGRCLSHSVLAPVAHSLRRRSANTLLNAARRFSTLTIPPFAPEFHLSHSTLSAASSSNYNAITYARESRLTELVNALDTHKSPSNVWTGYTNLLSVAGSDYLSLELHQRVLRACTPSTEELKAAIVRRLSAGNIPKVPHIHEIRFQTVIQNIRGLGLQPALDDYNFILEQFAAVGHYEGCFQVYKELTRLGHVPTTQTFSECFQSIAQRFKLPMQKVKREAISTQMQDIFAMYVADMHKHRVPMDATCFDFAIRVLKQTLDLPGFEALMRWGYAIDLSNPDRVALEYTDPVMSDPPLTPLPFTTRALNTTIDMLARFGDISKLVQAFEVLTQPLPQASQYFFDSFEADEDDDFGVRVDVASRFPPPYATPNTATYSLLLRCICRSGHAVLARHYLIQARRLDRAVAHVLRNRVSALVNSRRSLATVPAPDFAVNQSMLVSVLGEGNKDKDLGLLRWLQDKLPYIIRRQKADLDYYDSVVRNHRDLLPKESPTSPPTAPADADAETAALVQPARVKYFDPNLHVAFLRRNVSELQSFSGRIEFVVGRTHQRIKERLGRRVWQEKDVYIATENRRVKISKAHWKQTVNFQPRTDTFKDHLVNRRPWLPAHADPQKRRGLRRPSHSRPDPDSEP
ncbi:unnamed protein product [Cyclocybe aegerita]|uniref:Uncharacterized protein n=1 Tax=Cyclocybe aegerita TaxID=1973307 RepID=A0A8S0XET2_CYCAE|nr:unnamed protein product [Cyclocybe aegerita]